MNNESCCLYVAAQAQLDQSAAPAAANMPVATDSTQPTAPSTTTRPEPGITQPAAPALKRRYHGTVTLNPQRANRDIDVISRRSSSTLLQLTGSDVEITLLEISATNPADSLRRDGARSPRTAGR
ncbi:MAG: hypothetical protein R2856_28020 [Caldilineaceae bacterium]